MEHITLSRTAPTAQYYGACCAQSTKVEKPCSAFQLPSKIHLNIERKTTRESTAICYARTKDKAAKDVPIFARLPEKTSNPRIEGSQRPLTPTSSFYRSAVGSLERDTCSPAAVLAYAAAAGEPRQAFLASPAHDCPLWHGCS